jgi:hypothetical protein
MRRWLAALSASLFALLVPAVAQAKYRGTDVFGNLFPGGGDGGLADKYPLSYYTLDYHVAGPHIGVPVVGGGSSAGDIPATIAQFLASMLFMVTSWAMNLVINIFDWAFSVDLLNGAHGALAPVGRATQHLYDVTLGPEFLAFAVLCLGLWSVYMGIAKGRYGDVVAGVATSVLLTVVAMAFIVKPAETIGQASRMTNQLSSAFLSDVTTVKDHLFNTFVYRPWVIMEFAGLSHCVDAGHPDQDGFPRVVDADKPHTACRDHLTAHNGYGGYAPRYLSVPPGDDRDQMYEALKSGTPNDKWPDWKIDKADAPAVDIQQAGGAMQRFVLALLVLFAVTGAILTIGLVAAGALLFQLVALGLYAFAPVAMLAGLIPGWGHKIFRNWFLALIGTLFAKVLLSLGLEVLVGISIALSAATAAVGWMLFLQGGFYWTVFFKRKTIAHAVGIHRRDITHIEHHVSRVTTATSAVALGAVGGVSGVAATAGRRLWNRNDETSGDGQRTPPRPATEPVPTNGLPDTDESRTPQGAPAQATLEHTPNTTPNTTANPAPAPTPAAATSGREDLSAALDTTRFAPRTEPANTESGDGGREPSSGALPTAHRDQGPGVPVPPVASPGSPASFRGDLEAGRRVQAPVRPDGAASIRGADASPPPVRGPVDPDGSTVPDKPSGGPIPRDRIPD